MRLSHGCIVEIEGLTFASRCRERYNVDAGDDLYDTPTTYEVPLCSSFMTNA